jgi:hypothetical protein
MTAKQAIVLLEAKIREQQLARQYKLWSVGRFPTVHVTCLRTALARLHYGVDQLIKEHGGIRYADVASTVGMLGRSVEITFCFKLGVDKSETK